MSATSACKQEDDLQSKKPCLQENEKQLHKDDLVGLSSTVAAHYNKLEEKGLTERNKSRIVYQRNFNNWIKSILIGQYIDKCECKSKSIKVLDMCCGKGGDLLKWEKGKIKHLICVDIAEISINQCRSRYRSRSLDYTAEFIVADCTKTRLKDNFEDKSILLDIVSCQFSFHYCFESLPQAECMLRNASECLRPGGYFIGTMPNAFEIVARQKKANSLLFGNDVYKIQFHCDTNNIPIFGAKYDFYLEGVVNCPEFLVHFPTLIKLAEKYDLRLVMKENFPDFYKANKDAGYNLLRIIKAFEKYPPDHKVDLQGKAEEYVCAEEYLKHSRSKCIGTLSVMEWEIVSLYITFAFQKISPQDQNT